MESGGMQSEDGGAKTSRHVLLSGIGFLILMPYNCFDLFIFF
jgi:hypothetical protein